MATGVVWVLVFLQLIPFLNISVDDGCSNFMVVHGSISNTTGLFAMDSGHASLCYYIDHLTNSGCSEYIVGNLTIYF